jgi:hypothetical protein
MRPRAPVKIITPKKSRESFFDVRRRIVRMASSNPGAHELARQPGGSSAFLHPLRRSQPPRTLAQDAQGIGGGIARHGRKIPRHESA